MMSVFLRFGVSLVVATCMVSPVMAAPADLRSALHHTPDARSVPSDDPSYHDPSVAAHQVDATGLYSYPTPNVSGTKSIAMPEGDAQMMNRAMHLLAQRDLLTIQAQVADLQRQIAGPAGASNAGASSAASIDGRMGEVSPQQAQAEQEARAKAAEAARIAARNAAEEHSVPDIAEIFGTQHSWRARIILPGGSSTWVSPGDVVGGNLRVGRITTGTVDFVSADHERRYVRSVSSVLGGGSTPVVSMPNPSHSMATPLTGTPNF